MQHQDPSTTTPSVASTTRASEDIAIIGMAGRFPGAKNIGEFWENLTRGKESILRLTPEDLEKAGVPRREYEHPDYVPVCPILDDISLFDAAFFGMSPRDASVMDPAHRFFLEVAWEALEHSGNTGLPREGRVGVFAGSGAPLYWMNNVRTHREIMESMGEFLVRHTGNDMNFLATRASYDLDLRGPSVNVQTACSSALVAAHLARQSLLARECDMALIGGSTIVLPMGHGYHYKEGEILSPDGHCRPFDHRSAGTVFGSGTACLVLKRLSDALDNGDTIFAVIKGSAVNNDGSVKVGYLAPGVDGQVGVITDALEAAGVPARSIGYVEAHGTGTSVGDPIELTAIEQAYRKSTSDTGFCGIGSVKSNIGHLGEAAAGASLIKVALSLFHGKIPATLGYEKPNPRFAMEESPFFVNGDLRDWPKGPSPRRAGITALGAGGTNCHLVLEEPPPPLPGEGARARQLLVLSAKSKTSLDRMSENLADFLEREPNIDLADVAYTLALGRRPLGHRRVLAAKDVKEAVRVLRDKDASRITTSAADPNEPEVVFTFPGGGAQYARMCVDLYEQEPVYREALDECLAIIDGELDPKIRQLLFASKDKVDVATTELQRPSQALPILFAVEYSLARLFQSYGVVPVALVGHSMGEYVAACLASVFSLRDGLRLVHKRGQLFETVTRGKMVGVSLSEEETRSIMPAGLSIAAVNAPELCVASGASELIDRFSAELAAAEIDHTPIRIDVAAHSSLLESILPEFLAFCRTIRFSPPKKPIASNLTGKWLTAEEATSPEYWVKHLRGTVRFADCVETVLESGPKVFLEIGPGRTLTTLVQAQRTKVKGAVNSVRHPKEVADDMDYALATVGKVWANGGAVDFTAFYDGQLRNRIPLPTYPFDGQSYWVEPKKVLSEALEPEKRADMNEWFQTVTFEPAPLVPAAPAVGRPFVLLGRDNALLEELTFELGKVAPGARVVRVVAAKSFARVDGDVFETPFDAVSLRGLFDELAAELGTALSVVHLVSEEEVEAKPHDKPGLFGRKARGASARTPDRGARLARTESGIIRAFFEPVRVAQAIGGSLEQASLTIVTRGAFSLRGEAVSPAMRLALGPASVVPREMPDVATRLVDVLTHDLAGTPVRGSMALLAREIAFGGDKASPVVLRAPSRFVRRLSSIALPEAGKGIPAVVDGSVVFITGGLGGIGLTLARHLATKARCRFALLSRDGLPDEKDFDRLLNDGKTPAALRRRIAAVRELEALGSTVLLPKGDVANQDSLKGALALVHSRLGSIDLLIHAAGVMADEPLQTKSEETMRRVLAAKVLGTVNLDELIDYEVGAFVVMSSVASLLGLPGQVDYTAANAFLDAFVEERQARTGQRTIAINWNAWRDVGMVVDVRETPGSAQSAQGVAQTAQANPSVPGANAAPRPGAHPWLATKVELPSGASFLTTFGIESHWLLGEHQIAGGDALIPGTGFVELGRAAAAEALASAGRLPVGSYLELREVTFQSPFQVGPGETRTMHIEVALTGEGARVVLSSHATGEVHMTADVFVRPAAPETRDLAGIAARANEARKTREGFLDQDFVRFGGRWKNIRSLRFGGAEAVVQLELGVAYREELGTISYHPALLDMATGAAQPLIPGFDQAKDFYVPFGYDRISIKAPMTADAVSHVRLRPDTKGAVACFDVTVYDDSGRELIDIAGFTMKRVDRSSAITQARSSAAPEQASKSSSSDPGRASRDAMEALLREAITKEEGVVAFERAIAQSELSQVIASSVDVGVWLRKLARDAERLKGNGEAEAGPSFSRPSLASDYVEPAGPAERQLASIWSKLLGVSDVGALDDFFELGGNSLVAVRLFARIKKDFGISLPLSTLFQAPTIRSLVLALVDQGYVVPAEEERAATAEEGASTASLEPALPATVTTAAESSAARIRPPIPIRKGGGGLPLFLVHDGLGEVLLYRTLALRLAPEHTVYGLEPEKAGSRYLHTSIEEMARAKVQRIQSVQPHGPYLLGGLCAGGVIAYEIARQLETKGERVSFVGLIDAADVAAEEKKNRIASGRLERFFGTLRPKEDESLAQHLGTALPALAMKSVNLVKYETTTRLERLRNKKKVAELRRAEAAPESAPTIDFLKLYELAHKEHRDEGRLAGVGLTLFLATEGDGSVADQPFREIYAESDLGWGGRSTLGVEVIEVPGGHSSCLQEPHVGVIATEFGARLERAVARALAPTKDEGAPEYTNGSSGKSRHLGAGPSSASLPS